MSKRRHAPEMEKNTTTKFKKHWSLGLLESMNDPNQIYKETEQVVVIRDKYPKAKLHYLMLPRDNIIGIHNLNKEHISLLEEFGSLLKVIYKEHKEVIFKAGFHAVPSMQRLHMHIISTDMISPCLKTKVHWNSFTTDFFIYYEDLIKQLKQNGCIAKISSELHKELMAIPLKCNKCDYKPKNMPQLKEHLLKHVQK